jgi:hypothetical protein
MSQANRNAAREQIRINTRLTALQAAQDMMKVNSVGPVGAEDFIAYAKKVEDYILDGIETAKKESGLVIQTQMPPEGMFHKGK